MILAIETSTSKVSLSVWNTEEKKIEWEDRFTSNRSHNVDIFSSLEKVLLLYKNKLDKIIVGIGPGSYGGIRVGISVANGIHLVKSIPIRGISSLSAFKTIAPEESSFFVISDARQNSFSIAKIVNRELKEPIRIVSNNEFEDSISILKQHDEYIYTSDKKLSSLCKDIKLSYPEASILLKIISNKDESYWMEDKEFKPLEPIYLRPPYITTPKSK